MAGEIRRDLLRPRMDPRGTVLERCLPYHAWLLGESAWRGVRGVHASAQQARAIKLIGSDLAANREALARFHREAEITSHTRATRTCVTVIDFGQAESGEPYLVMEYLDR